MRAIRADGDDRRWRIPLEIEAFCLAGVTAFARFSVRMRTVCGLVPLLPRSRAWVPDVRSPDFAAEAHRQSALVAASDRASDDKDFVEAVSDDWDE